MEDTTALGSTSQPEVPQDFSLPEPLNGLDFDPDSHFDLYQDEEEVSQQRLI